MYQLMFMIQIYLLIYHVLLWLLFGPAVAPYIPSDHPLPSSHHVSISISISISLAKFWTLTGAVNFMQYLFRILSTAQSHEQIALY